LISFVAFVLLWALLWSRLVCISNITGREVFKLMGRVLGLSLCENMPLGIPLASGFFKLLAIDGLFPEHPTLEDLAEMDQGLHRSLAVALPSMPAMELREALQCLTFSVPSRTQSQAAVLVEGDSVRWLCRRPHLLRRAFKPLHGTASHSASYPGC